MENNKTAFSLKKYKFDKANLDFELLKNDSVFSVNFEPSGKYSESKGLYQLTFIFKAWIDEEENKKQLKDNPVVTVRCIAAFKFNNPIKLDEIPNFFYPNSIAILFPYIRAFVSTLSLQANIKPIVLPTLNLTFLQEELKQKTVCI